MTFDLLSAKRRLIVLIARLDSQSVPWVEALGRVGRQGVNQMLKVQVLKRVGDTVTLDRNGEELAALYLVEEQVSESQKSNIKMQILKREDDSI